MAKVLKGVFARPGTRDQVFDPEVIQQCKQWIIENGRIAPEQPHALHWPVRLMLSNLNGGNKFEYRKVEDNGTDVPDMARFDLPQ